ncbi:radical SAM protein [Sphingomonadales bacterium EhC05]|nr:radical SAM protein [Sphingomonadales bacterium EhC05]
MAETRPLAHDKFKNPLITAKGEPRATVAMTGLETLWFNTGTLCNLACKSCYIESSPTNDALVYISLEEVRSYLDEIADCELPTREIAFTGGEPFMNGDMIPILDLCLERGFEVLLLSNAMRPMQRFEKQLLALTFRDKLTLRVSLDHFTQQVHEAERGAKSWDKAIDGLIWLASNDFRTTIAGRQLEGESEAAARMGYAELFAAHDLPIVANDPMALVLFPEMDEKADIAEITTACWGILDVAPASIMCASSRMVVKRKGETVPRVAACTLLPYDPQFDMGATLAEASQSVKLNHPHCARFCVLGGASCSA